MSWKAWMLPWIFQEFKKYPRKTCVCGQPRGHLIWVLNERSISEGGNFSLLRLVILQSVWYSVGDNTVGHELWLAILSSLLCPKMDWNICIGKQGYCVYFIKNWCFDVSFLTSVCQQIFWDWEKLILRNILFIGLVLFDCRLRLLENFFWIVF